MTKRLNRQIYNVATIDQNGKVDIIRRKYNSIYSYFTRELPEADKLLNAYIYSNAFEYSDEIKDNSQVQNVVNRYPKKPTIISVLKPTAIKDLDSIDAKYRDNQERYDLAINKEELFQIIRKNIASGREVMSIDLGNGILFNLEYQLQTNTKQFILDVANAHARYESKNGLDAEAIIALAISVKEILDAKDTSSNEISLAEHKHRWGTSHHALIGKLNIPLYGSHGEDLKRKHPLINLVKSTDIEG